MATDIDYAGIRKQTLEEAFNHERTLDLIAKLASKTRTNDCEYAFIVYDDITHSKIVEGGKERVSLSQLHDDCLSPILTFHTHPGMKLPQIANSVENRIMLAVFKDQYALEGLDISPEDIRYSYLEYFFRTFNAGDVSPENESPETVRSLQEAYLDEMRRQVSPVDIVLVPLDGRVLMQMWQYNDLVIAPNELPDGLKNTPGYQCKLVESGNLVFCSAYYHPKKRAYTHLSRAIQLFSRASCEVSKSKSEIFDLFSKA